MTYPFKSFDGKQTIDRQRSGQRVYDINVDGVAHYGLFPDWVEDLRHIGGQEVVDDLGRGAEAYLQMWERADGVPRPRCQPAKGRATRRGLTRVRLGASAGALLRRAGQPRTRGRTWTWCAPGGRITAVLVAGRPRDDRRLDGAGARARGRGPRRPAVAARAEAHEAVRPRAAGPQARRRRGARCCACARAGCAGSARPRRAKRGAILREARRAGLR